MKPLKVLCLDLEGGFGGSSRSLFESLKHMDRNAIDPTVWCRKDGPVRPRYDEIDIKTVHQPQMPRVSSLPRFSRNMIVYGIFIRDWLCAEGFREQLLNAANEYDLIHFNHEGLFFLARWLRRRLSIPLTMHIRTNLYPSCFARFQERTIIENLDHLVFITENERQSLERLAGRVSVGTVIHNIAEPPNSDEHCWLEKLTRDPRFKIASLSNYAWFRGTDRLVEIAEVLKRRRCTQFVFFVAGTMSLTRSLEGELGEVARRGGTLVDFAKRRGVEDWFCFFGHVDRPDIVLEASQVLIKPTREANPWSRDILEALAARVPVISCGTDSTFVETGATGMLQDEFDAEGVADFLIRLADDPDKFDQLRSGAKMRAEFLCGGIDRSADLLSVWRMSASR